MRRIFSKKKKCKNLFELLLKEQELSANTEDNIDLCTERVEYLLSRNAALTTYIDNLEKKLSFSIVVKNMMTCYLVRNCEK